MPVSDEEVVPELLFTENETNFERLYGGKNRNIYAKDAFHDHIVPSHRLEKDRPQAVKKTRPIKKTVTRKVKKAAPNGVSQPNGTKSTDKENDAAEEEEEEEITEEVDDEEEYWEGPTDTNPKRDYVNPEKKGTKAGVHYTFNQVPAHGGCAVVRMKLTPKTPQQDPAIDDDERFDAVVESRRHDADEFYARIASGPITDDMKNIMRQALSGMLW